VDDRRVVCSITAQQITDHGPIDAELAGIEVVFGDETARHLPNVTVPRCGEFVEAVVAAKDQRRRATGLENTDKKRYPIQSRHSNRRGFGACRVAERAEKVEDRRNTQFGPDGTGVAKTGMKRGGKSKGDTGLVEDRGHPLGGQSQIDAQRRKHVGGAGCRAGGLVPVFDHGDSGGRTHNGGHRRNVHGAEPVSPGTDDVKRHRIDVQRQGLPQDCVAETDDLIDGLTLRPQRHQKGRQLSRGRLPAHDLLHTPRGIGHAEVSAVEESVQDIRPRLNFEHISILWAILAVSVVWPGCPALPAFPRRTTKDRPLSTRNIPT
jgi:hypothetical protein